MKKNFLITISMLVIGMLIVGAMSSAAIAEEPEYRWNMQVIHSPGHINFELNQKTAEKIYEATGGRLEIDVHPNNTFAQSMEAFQATSEGVFAMHSSWPTYMQGIDLAFQIMGTGNLTKDAIAKWMWIYEHGGWDLMQETFDQMNLKLLAVEVWGTEVLHSTEEITSLQDMAGGIMRTSVPAILPEIGVTGQPLPIEEVFTGFATGEVDYAEFGYLQYNEGLGLLDIANYGIYPDFWNVHNVTTVVVNKDYWNELPDDIQLIVEMAFQSDEIRHFTRSQYESAKLQRRLEATGEMEFPRIPDEEFVELREKMFEIELERMEEEGGMTEKIYESIHEFREIWYPYQEVAKWWGIGLTAEEALGYSLDDIQYFDPLAD